MLFFKSFVYQVSRHMLKKTMILLIPKFLLGFFDVIQHKFLSSLHVIKFVYELILNLASKPY